MDVLDGVISELRSLCASLPDKRTGSNIRHEMADFGLSALSLYLHAEPVVPGPSACTFGRAGVFERRNVVRHVADPDGQPDPRDAGSGDAGQALSALRFAAGTASSLTIFRPTARPPSTTRSPHPRPDASCAAWSSTSHQSTPAGLTWSRSRSASCAAST